MRDFQQVLRCNSLWLCGLAVLISILIGCASTGAVPGAAKRAALHVGDYPGQSRASEEEVALGKMLFFDARLSTDKSLSCATCHDPAQGFGDARPLARGLNGKELKRHTPHLYNLAWGSTFFWDGRATSLEEQALDVIRGPDEFNISPAELEARLSAVPYYAGKFASLYPDGVRTENVAKAIAAFERSLVSHNAPFDRYLGGNESAISEAAVLGMRIFYGKGNCSRCHSGPNFSDGKFHNTGVAGDDPGRSQMDRTGEFQTTPYPFFHTQRAFKTPGLRNIEMTSPYMHNGSEGSLEDVIEFYNAGGRDRESYGLSLDVRPLGLSKEEKAGLLAFLQSLSSPVLVVAPKLP